MPSPEQPRLHPETQRAIRAKYLNAMGIAMGAHPLTVTMSTEILLQQAPLLAAIDISKGASEPGANKHDVEQIEAIGSWFLNGSPQQKYLKFTVGARALSLLREDPSSGFFTNLAAWIQRWNDGDSETAVEVFNKLIQ